MADHSLSVQTGRLEDAIGNQLIPRAWIYALDGMCGLLTGDAARESGTTIYVHEASLFDG